MRWYGWAAGSAFSSLTVRFSMSASVTTIFCARGSKLSHLKTRNGSDVFSSIRRAALVCASPSKNTQVFSKRIPSPAEPPTTGMSSSEA